MSASFASFAMASGAEVLAGVAALAPVALDEAACRGVAGRAAGAAFVDFVGFFCSGGVLSELAVFAGPAPAPAPGRAVDFCGAGRFSPD
ncbi:hypothetical protein DMB66_54900 [Actinoplanes sp. ATCC 53533]|nr:hypothetical protein DMB66_54900 [Actinoplanes sp. ATCC 53533]